MSDERFRHRIGWIATVFAFFCISARGAAPFDEFSANPATPAEPELTASVQAVVPGESFDVAVSFEMASGWRIYWSNPGDSGMPTRVVWSLPDGFQVGPLRFPAPRREIEAGGKIHTFILDSQKPTLIATLTAPDVIETDTVALEADVFWLACSKTCVPGHERLRLELPVAKPESKPALTNLNLFEHAYQALPAQRSDFVTLTPKVKGFQRAPGTGFEFILEVDVKPGLHLQSNAPLQPTLLATDVMFDPTEGVTFERPRYPTPAMREISSPGQVAEFDDQFEITVGARIDDDAQDIASAIHGVFVFQARDDQGVYFEPQALAFSVPLGDQPAVAAARDSGSVVLTAAVEDEEARGIALTFNAQPNNVVQLDAALEKAPAELKGEFNLQLKATVKRGMHIQSNAPLIEGLIPTRVEWKTPEGVRVGEMKYPEPEIHQVPGLGRTAEFKGVVTLTAPVTIDEAWKGEALDLGGKFHFQACTDQGQCFPPDSIGFSVKLASGGTGAPTQTNPSQTESPGESVSETPAETGAKSETPETMAGGTSDSGERVDSVSPPPSAALAAPKNYTLPYMLLLGFLGGLILNIMPCVLPVISIKVLSFVQQAGEDRKRIMGLGLAFCGGIMAWFWGFATLTLFFKQQALQDPLVVIVLVSIMFVFGLSLFGVFEITLPGFAASAAVKATQKEGYGGAFVKGVLATLLGTACTAPLLAGALAWTVTQPAAVGFAVFTAAGLGMALPYLLLSIQPAWMKYLPKPGTWMITFKQFMGFLMMGTAVWLMMTVAAQGGAASAVQTVSFLTFLALSCWLIGKIGFSWSPGRQWATWGLALAVAGFGGWFSYKYLYNSPIKWVHYEKGLAEELSRQGRIVLVDYTATWCATCQANKAVAIEIDSTARLMDSLEAVAIKADFSAPNPDIAEDLQKWGRPSVPLCLVYSPGKPDAPLVLPVALTPGIVQEALEKAARTAYATTASTP